MLLCNSIRPITGRQKFRSSRRKVDSSITAISASKRALPATASIDHSQSRKFPALHAAFFDGFGYFFLFPKNPWAPANHGVPVLRNIAWCGFTFLVIGRSRDKSAVFFGAVSLGSPSKVPRGLLGVGSVLPSALALAWNRLLFRTHANRIRAQSQGSGSPTSRSRLPARRPLLDALRPNNVWLNNSMSAPSFGQERNHIDAACLEQLALASLMAPPNPPGSPVSSLDTIHPSRRQQHAPAHNVPTSSLNFGCGRTILPRSKSGRSCAA